MNAVRTSICLAAAGGAMLSLASLSFGQTILITQDSYMDSTYSVKNGIVVADTQDINFDTYTGTSGSSMTPSNLRVKVVSSNGSTQFPGNSKVHGIFYLPQGFWDAFDAGRLNTATVSFHIFNNSLNTGSFSDARDVELHPMTQQWGLTTSTWRTYDGVHPWSTTDTGADHDDPGTGGGGGDYDAARFLDTVNPNVASTTIVSWNITPFLTDPVAMNEMRLNGALLKETNELNFEGNRFYSMYSYNNGDDTAPFVTLNPEPASLAPILACTWMLNRTRRRRHAGAR